MRRAIGCNGNKANGSRTDKRLAPFIDIDTILLILHARRAALGVGSGCVSGMLGAVEMYIMTKLAGRVVLVRLHAVVLAR